MSRMGWWMTAVAAIAVACDAAAAQQSGEAVDAARQSAPGLSAREGDAVGHEIDLHPGALVQLVDQLGGRAVRLPRSRVVAVLNSRLFLVESASALPPSRRFDRLLVVIDRGELRVDAATLVGWNVTVHGIARTLLGLQITGEAAWPRELTRQVLDRYDIGAGVLASSVRTADGVELIVPQQPSAESAKDR